MSNGTRWHVAGSLLSGVVFLALAAGCVNADTEAPAAPRFARGGAGPVAWRLPTITLQGTAEYGAALTLTREPAFSAEEAPAAQSADPYTAFFSYPSVPLAKGLNTFTLVATDDAGNASAAGTLLVEYADLPAGGLTLSLSTPVVTAGNGAGQGAIEARAQLLESETGFALDGREIVFTLSGVGTETKSGTTDAKGRAVVSFSGLVAAGVGTITASLKEAPSQADAASFVVNAGAPATLSLGLRKSSVPGAGSEALAITAGDEVTAVVSVKDAGANGVGAPVQLFTDAPGALVAGLTIRNLNRVGSWKVVAAVAGVATEGGLAVSATGTVTVSPGAPARVLLTAPTTAIAGDPFLWSAALVDAFGNAVEVPAGSDLVLSSSTDASLASDAANGSATLTKAGAQALSASLSASLSGAAGVTAGTASVLVAAASPAEVVLTLSATDAVPATSGLEVEAGANTSVGVSTTVYDRFRNTVPTGVIVTTDAAAPFDGAALRGLTRAGVFEVVASVPNTLVAARSGFAVLAGAPASLSLTLATSSTAAGSAVGYVATARDALGNVTTDAPTVGIDALGAAFQTIDASAKTIAVTKSASSAYTVSARLAGTTLTKADAPLLVSPAAAASIVIDPGTPASVTAGAQPAFTVTVADAFGNSLVNPAVQQAVLAKAGTLVEPPGPIVSGGKIYNLVRPGNYLLTAQVVGTSLVTDDTSSRASLIVTAAEAASVDLSLARSVAEVGSPVALHVAVRDAYGNTATGQPVISVTDASGTVAAAVGGGAWSASYEGTYTLTATLTVGGRTLTDSETLVVTAAPDTAGPTITFDTPAGHPTIAAWPPAGVAAASSCPTSGAVASVTIADTSLVSNVWMAAAGFATPFPGSPSLTFPMASVTYSGDLCTSAAGVPVRGEVLVDVGAADLKGNYRSAAGGWCVDADAGGYLPANASASRCAVVRADAAIANPWALAADPAGDLAIVRASGSGEAQVARFVRAAGGTYGLGTGHALTGYTAPRGAALSSDMTWVSALAADGSAAVVRTRGLTRSGEGSDDAFVKVALPNERFEGVVVGLNGALYAVSNTRTGTAGGKLWRFDRPLDVATRHTAMPAAPVASSTTVRLTGVCNSLRDGELFATGVTGSGASARGTVVRISLSSGTMTTLFTDTESRAIGGCAASEEGVVVGLGKGSGSGGVTVIDGSTGALAAKPYLSDFSASSALAGASWPVVTQGFVFALGGEGSGATLVRFAQTDGF